MENVMKDQASLNLDDPFERVVYEMVQMNRRKRADYAGDGNPFQNFIDSSYQINATPGVSCEVLIGTKQARLRNLLGTNRDVQNESVEDTVLDRAVYSTIALAMYREGLYDNRWAEKDQPHTNRGTVRPNLPFDYVKDHWTQMPDNLKD